MPPSMRLLRLAKPLKNTEVVTSHGSADLASSTYQRKLLNISQSKLSTVSATNSTIAVLNTTCNFLTTSSHLTRMNRLTRTCGRVQHIAAAHKIRQAAEVRSRDANIELAAGQHGAEMGETAAFDWKPADEVTLFATHMGL